MGTIIEVVKRRNIVTGSDQHIAEITGQEYIHKPHYYRNTETGAEYSYLAGGIGWPGERPGFIVVVAVQKESETLHVLAEVEASSIRELLSECLKLRQMYGYGQGSDLFDCWYGENERFDTFVADFNHNLELEGENAEGIYLVPPHDYQKTNAFEIWLNRIHSSLTRDASGKKALFLGGCDKLRNHIQNLPHDAAAKGSIEDYPAITALGGTLHSLMMLRPWMQFLNHEETIPTVKDNYVDFAQREHEQVMRDLFGGDDYGDMDEYDTGELISTI
jgi:hypothetical protein